MSHISEQLDSLVDQITRYESNPRSLDSAAFVADLRNLTATFDLIRHHDERKKEFDRRLYHHINSRDMESSHLRSVTLHWLATAFEFYANRGGSYADAYEHARRARRDATGDAPFLHTVLLAKLLDPVNMKVPAEVRFALLCQIAEMENLDEVEPIFDDKTSVPDIKSKTREMFALGLIRRWLATGKQNLPQIGRFVENRLFHLKVFEEFARFDPVLAQILGLRGLNYRVRPPWYRRLMRSVAVAFRNLWAGIVGLPYRFGRALPGVYLLLGAMAVVLAIIATVMLLDADAAWRTRVQGQAHRESLNGTHLGVH